MKQIEFKLEGEYIELIQLLKVIGVAQTGGHAKMIVDRGEVIRENTSEFRKRAKLRQGEVIQVKEQMIIFIV